MARDKQFLSIHARDCSSILRCKQRRLSLTIAKPDHSKSALLDSFGFFRDLALLPFPSLSAPGLFRVESLYEDTDFAQQVWCYVLGVAMWCLVCCRCRDHMNCMSLHKLHHQLHSVAVNVVPSCLRLASRSPEISLRVGLLIYSPICGSLWRREWSIQLWKSENFAEFSLKLKAFAERDKSSCEFSNVCCSAKSLLAMSSYHWLSVHVEDALRLASKSFDDLEAVRTSVMPLRKYILRREDKVNKKAPWCHCSVIVMSW